MIYKFDQGGSALPPFVSYEPVIVTGGATGTSATTSTESTKKGLSDDDIIKLLEKVDGLPNDIDKITRDLQNFRINSEYGFNTSSIASQYLQTSGAIAKAKFNRQEYEDAYKTVSANGGINELAVNDRGQLYCVNSEGDYQLLTLDQLKKAKGYQPLTNSELLRIRAYSPTAAMDPGGIIKTVKNGIGISKINEQIQSIISHIGTSTQSNEGYANTKSTQIINGLQAFMEAQQKAGDYKADVDNLYKGKYLTKSQAKQAEQALAYIYATLPENAKTLLQTKTKEGTKKEVYDLIGMLVSSTLDTEESFSLSLHNPIKDKKTSDENKDKRVLDLVTAVQSGEGGHDSVITLDNGNGIAMTMEGTAYEQIKDTNGKHIGKTSMDNMINDSGLRSISNMDNQLYFGNQKISPDMLTKITYDGNGVYRVNLPIKEDGSPDFDILDEYSRAYAQFMTSDGTEEDRKEIFGSNPKLNYLFNPDGTQNLKRFAPFIVASGMTTDALVSIDKNNKLVVDKGQTPDLVAELRESLSTGTGKNKVTPDVDVDDWTETLFGWLGNKYDHIIKGNIYIPLNMNKQAAALGGGQNLSIREGQDLEQEYQQSSIEYNSGDASLLNN